MAQIVCAKCNEEHPEDQIWWEVVGFEPPRKQGGANQVALRVRTGSGMCNGCMEKAKLQVRRGPVDRALF